MANKPRITLGLPDHPRCRALIDGKVGVEGYELDIDPNFVSSGERHYKYLHGGGMSANAQQRACCAPSKTGSRFWRCLCSSNAVRASATSITAKGGCSIRRN